MNSLQSYLAPDRRRTLARHTALPDRAIGTVLFADISGFTPLTDTLTRRLGARRGAEELSSHLNQVYATLISRLEHYGGSVVGFAGDAVTCWFEQSESDLPAAIYATNAALDIHAAMLDFPELAVKIALATGPVRRWAVGDPHIQLLDTLAGATLARLAAGDHLARSTETLADEATVQAIGDHSVADWRTDSESGCRFAVLNPLKTPTAAGVSPIVPAAPDHPPTDEVRPWLLPAVYEREQAGLGDFLTELRNAVAVFLRFDGIDYDDDPAAGDKLNRFIRQAQGVVHRHGGALLALTIGDKGSYVGAAFGAPIAHEDDARRAVQAALNLRALAARLDFLAPVQIGLSGGLMRIGAYGSATRRTYGVLGDEVNLAARLMQTAAPGDILIAAHLQPALSKDFTFDPGTTVYVKGKAEPVPVFRVRGEQQRRAIRLQEPQYALPIVGRQAELRQIGDKLALARQGQAQVIGITAQAGLGKSRLVAEVTRLARDQGFVGYGGACQSDGVNTPYLVWQAVWTAFFDVDPAQSVVEQIRALAASVQARTPQRVSALPLLRILLNVPIPVNQFTQSLEPKYRQSTLHALLEECMRDAARTAPVLIVLEDLHWMDALSRDLLEELTLALSDSPICFVLAYRPPQPVRIIAPRYETRPNFTRIELSELTAPEAEQVLRAKLTQLYPNRGRAVPPALVATVMARTQGNPFFLEELLNFVRDRQLDPRDPAVLAQLDLPASLHTLILSRLDQLSEREKTVLRVASIIGRLFRAAWLSGYYPALGELPAIRSELDHLSKLDITLPDTTGPELAYLFKHIITHEVTYESLAFATRARLHEQLAQYLEQQIAASELAESVVLDMLVYHYLRSDNLAKQRAYLVKASQAALAASAFTTAVAYLTRLLEIVPETDPAHTTSALQLAEAHYNLGNFSAARMAVQQAQAAAQTDRDRTAALIVRGEITSLLGDYDAARTLLVDALPLARSSGDVLLLCRALYALGDVNWRRGKFEDAQTALTESLALARESGDTTREMFALNRLAMTLADEAAEEQLYHQVYDLAVATGNRERAMAALNNLGVMVGVPPRRDHAAAYTYFEQVLALAREVGSQYDICLSLLNLGSSSIELGQLATASAWLREALAVALRLDIVPFMVTAIRNLGDLAVRKGDVASGLALCGMARGHPAWNSEHQRQMDETIGKWKIAPAMVAEGMTKGAALDWDATIQELMRE